MVLALYVDTDSAYNRETSRLKGEVILIMLRRKMQPRTWARCRSLVSGPADVLLLLLQLTAAASSSCCMQMHIHLAPIQATLLKAIQDVYKSGNATWHLDCGGYSTLRNCKPLGPKDQIDPAKHLKVSERLPTSVI